MAAPPSNETDEALMLAFARGNMNAFEQLYDRHETGVWRFGEIDKTN